MMNDPYSLIEELPELLKPSEVAKLFRVDPKTVTRWAKTGKLQSMRTVGGHRRYYRDDVISHLEQRQVNR